MNAASGNRAISRAARTILVAACAMAAVAAPARAELPTCPYGMPDPHVAHIQFTAAQRAELNRTLSLPAVQSVRDGIARFRAGRPNAEDRYAFRKISDRSLSPAIALWSIDRAPLGGYSMYVTPQNRPDAIYFAWTYPEGRPNLTHWQLRDFERTACKPAVVRRLGAIIAPVVYR